MLSFTGKSVVVTGASQGIGAAIAEAFHAAGALVHGLSRSGSAPDGASGIKCDVANPEDVRRAFATVGATGPLYALINAAGAGFPQGADAEAEAERFRRTVEINLTGPYLCALAARPLFTTPGASIVNITSINAVRGFPGNPGYVAAKAGLSGLTRALAADFAAEGVRVNAVAPGYVHTAMTAGSFADEDRRADRARHTLLNRWGQPDEIAAAVLFIASDAASYITGQELFVDGGWTAKGLIEASKG